MTESFNVYGANVEQHTSRPDRWFVTPEGGREPIGRLEERDDGFWAFAI